MLKGKREGNRRKVKSLGRKRSSVIKEEIDLI